MLLNLVAEPLGIHPRIFSEIRLSVAVWLGDVKHVRLPVEEICTKFSWDGDGATVLGSKNRFFSVFSLGVRPQFSTLFVFLSSKIQAVLEHKPLGAWEKLEPSVAIRQFVVRAF